MTRIKKILNLKTQSKSKRQKLSPVDRISDLPDSLLCHILSFLSTKESVATSILSSRWTTLWTHVPNLDLKDSTSSPSNKDNDDDNRMSFTHFVCRIFALLKAPTLQNFKLSCRDTDPFHVSTWICAALHRGVKEVDLRGHGGKPVHLPRDAFRCESLVALKLGACIVLSCPSSIHLPSLKILHLRFVKCVQEDSLDRLFSACPILEYLIILDTPTFNISIPSLKRLHLYISKANSRCELKINTPSLNELSISTHRPADYLLENLPNLVEAKFKLYLTEQQFHGESYGACLLKLLRKLCDVKVLSLSYNAISCGIDNTYDGPPMFRNLVNVSLTVDSFDCYVLKTLLENSPNLKFLEIFKVRRVTDEARDSWWSQPSRVPECLSSSLQTFRIRNFEGEELELKFVEYILKNARVLETTTVCTCNILNLERNFNIIKKLSMFPRGSSACQLSFN